MRLTCLAGERGGDDDEFGALSSQGLEQLWEAQVVADAEANLHPRQFDHDTLITRLETLGFAIATVGIADIDVEQMNLVVAAHHFPGSIQRDAGRATAAIG